MTARQPNLWLEDAMKFGKTNDSFVALSPRENPISWAAWRDYFRWLNWAPHWFLEVERFHVIDKGSDKTWTAPCDHPDKFKCQFKQSSGPPPVFPLTAPKPIFAGQRVGHIEELRARGLLTFDQQVDKTDRRSWFQKLSYEAAKRNLEIFE
jgi:hypothetical protein